MSGGAWVPEPELAEIPFCRDSVSVDSVPGSCVLVEETLEEPEESEAEEGTDVQPIRQLEEARKTESSRAGSTPAFSFPAAMMFSTLCLKSAAPSFRLADI